MSFKERFKSELERNGLNKSEAANAIGVHRSSITRYVQGTATPGGAVLNRMCNLFQVTPDYLLDKSDIRMTYGDNDIFVLMDKIIKNQGKHITINNVELDSEDFIFLNMNYEKFKNEVKLYLYNKNKKDFKFV